MKKRILSIYVVIMLGLIVCLGISTLFKNNVNPNEQIVSRPVLVNDGVINENFLDESENYISQQYALRNILMDMYTQFLVNVFHTSPVNNVILGKNGYLYFKDTLEDYKGTRKLSKRELFQISRTLELMNEYVNKNNAQFVFAVAPNKNSLYDYMPYYIQKEDDYKLTYDLYNQLENVNYVNLFELFKHKNKELYYKTDSHWNDEGAYYAYEEMMRSVNKTVKDYTYYSLKDEKVKGDLYHMLYPNRSENESTQVIDMDKSYEYITKTRSPEQSYIESRNDQGQGSLLMFRDSFANNLIQYFSNEYQYAIYDKSISYNLMNMRKYDSDTVILEIAERNVKNIQERCPQFIAPSRKLSFKNVKEENFISGLSIKANENTVIQGNINEFLLEDNSYIYMEVNGQYYELTPQMINDKYGFYGILDRKIDKCSIYIVNNDVVYKQNITSYRH